MHSTIQTEESGYLYRISALQISDPSIKEFLGQYFCLTLIGCGSNNSADPDQKQYGKMYRYGTGAFLNQSSTAIDFIKNLYHFDFIIVSADIITLTLSCIRWVSSLDDKFGDHTKEFRLRQITGPIN